MIKKTKKKIDPLNLKKGDIWWHESWAELYFEVRKTTQKKVYYWVYRFDGGPTYEDYLHSAFLKESYYKSSDSDTTQTLAMPIYQVAEEYKCVECKRAFLGDLDYLCERCR